MRGCLDEFLSSGAGPAAQEEALGWLTENRCHFREFDEEVLAIAFRRGAEFSRGEKFDAVVAMVMKFFEDEAKFQELSPTAFIDERNNPQIKGGLEKLL